MSSLYGRTLLKESAYDEDLSGVDLQPYVQLMAYEDAAFKHEDEIKTFTESEECKVLMEKQVLNKSSYMRLSKADDYKRRLKLVAYNLAKENNDPDYKKMKMHRAKFKQFRAKVLKKYGNRAKKIATVSQREYIKQAKKLPQGKVPSGVPTN